MESLHKVWCKGWVVFAVAVCALRTCDPKFYFVSVRVLYWSGYVIQLSIGPFGVGAAYGVALTAFGWILADLEPCSIEVVWCIHLIEDAGLCGDKTLLSNRTLLNMGMARDLEGLVMWALQDVCFIRLLGQVICIIQAGFTDTDSYDAIACH